jgi:hypothetical protein
MKNSKQNISCEVKFFCCQSCKTSLPQGISPFGPYQSQYNTTHAA